MQKQKDNKLFKGKYWITFYDWDDETFLIGFDNLEQICLYKGLEVNAKNMNKINMGLYRALRRKTHRTRLLNDDHDMHVYLIDMSVED